MENDLNYDVEIFFVKNGEEKPICPFCEKDLTRNKIYSNTWDCESCQIWCRVERNLIEFFTMEKQNTSFGKFESFEVAKRLLKLQAFQ